VKIKEGRKKVFGVMYIQRIRMSRTRIDAKKQERERESVCQCQVGEKLAVV